MNPAEFWDYLQRKMKNSNKTVKITWQQRGRDSCRKHLTFTYLKFDCTVDESTEAMLILGKRHWGH
jgi:hypothetical protein